MGATSFRRWLRSGSLIVVYLAVVLIGYLGWVGVRSWSLYDQIKPPRRGWSGSVTRADPELGFTPVPGARAAHVFPIGPDVPTRFDERGTRVPVDFVPGPARAPVILSLGCSFTYGDACLAEDAFTYRAARALGGTAVNGGVCGYGLAQMLLRAGRLVPEIDPDVLLVQYSPWLVDRARSQTAPVYFGLRPKPYFGRADGAPLGIVSPAFPPLSGLDVGRFRSGEARLTERLRFLGEFGLPLHLHEDYHRVGLRWRAWLGLLPEPARVSDRDAIVAHVYGALRELATAHGARLVVVRLEHRSDAPELPGFFEREGFAVVDGHAALLDWLARDEEPLPGASLEERYRRAFYHWRGTPPEIVDGHPNPHAHGLVAAAIVAALRG